MIHSPSLVTAQEAYILSLVPGIPLLELWQALDTPYLFPEVQLCR